MADDAAEELLFVYTGQGDGAVIPEDVVRVQIDPSMCFPCLHKYKLISFCLHF